MGWDDVATTSAPADIQGHARANRSGGRRGRVLRLRPLAGRLGSPPDGGGESLVGARPDQRHRGLRGGPDSCSRWYGVAHCSWHRPQSGAESGHGAMEKLLTQGNGRPEKRKQPGFRAGWDSARWLVPFTVYLFPLCLFVAFLWQGVRVFWQHRHGVLLGGIILIAGLLLLGLDWAWLWIWKRLRPEALV